MIEHQWSQYLREIYDRAIPFQYSNSNFWWNYKNQYLRAFFSSSDYAKAKSSILPDQCDSWLYKITAMKPRMVFDPIDTYVVLITHILVDVPTWTNKEKSEDEMLPKLINSALVIKIRSKATNQITDSLKNVESVPYSTFIK